MFCPNCGKGEQAPDSYCRSCGEFLTDFSAKSFLLHKLLGGSSPDAQVNINLAINIATILVSTLLLGFLNGYYDSLQTRTGESAPSIIYLVYIFLGVISGWQFLSLLVNVRLKRKLSGRKKGEAPVESNNDEKPLSSGTTQKSLPEPDFDNLAPGSVTEDATQILDASPRKRT